MLDFVLLAKAVLAASVVAAAVMGGARWRSPTPWRSSACWSWAVGAGVLAASGVADQWPHWPALEDRARFLTIVVPLCMAVETVAASLRSTRAAWLLRLALAAAVTPTLLYNTVYLADLSGPGSAEWSNVQAIAILAGLATLLAMIWLMLHRLQLRTSTATVQWILVLDSLAAAVTVMLSGYYRAGQLGLILAAALAGATLASHFGKPHASTSGSLGMSVVGIFSVVVIGRYFGALSSSLAVCLLVAPLLAWTFELPRLRTLPPKWRTAGRLACVAIPLAVVVAVAYGEFVAATRARSNAQFSATLDAPPELSCHVESPLLYYRLV